MDYSKLEDITIPTREDAIYKEIENFQEYELTQCVAYEMAVRCPTNHQLIKNFINYYQLYTSQY